MRVLVVEDEPDLLASLLQAVREDGYAADGAGDGVEGFYKAETFEYDAVVLDIMLPGMDGWEVLRRLRKIKATPVLLLTARDAVRDRVRDLVGRPLAPDLAAMQRLALWLVAGGRGILAVGPAGGWWVAFRAMQPIEEISATARKISAVDLSQRISVADTDDELAWLAEILNSTFGRLESAFKQQARFTANASRELRTPLAVLLSKLIGRL
ncbi:MAG: response regulator [Verrucomicrobia bacterium]|nr:response regulator [Verrucomicrobiota bacterium]